MIGVAIEGGAMCDGTVLGQLCSPSMLQVGVSCDEMAASADMQGMRAPQQCAGLQSIQDQAGLRFLHRI